MDCRTYSSININELAEPDFRALRDSIPLHGVICLKGQSLTLDEQVALTKRMGEPLLLHEALRFNNTMDAYPEVARVSNVLPCGTLIPGHHAAEYWHSDGDFWQPGRNYIFNFLYAEIVPPVGGQTQFADLRLAFESLSESTKEQISELEVLVSCDDIPDFQEVAPELREPDARHSIRHVHPETGRTGLYFGHTKATIDGVSQEISNEVLAQLTAAIEHPENQYIHEWEPGDLLMWDNTSVMHRGMGGYGDHPRLLFRSQAFMEPKLSSASAS